MDNLVNSLAQEATARGMDSTGIAYNKDNKLTIYKKPLCAYDMEFKGLENAVCVTGHTRHATQGSETKNYNNHPFMGYCENAKFALAHNGVLWNDRTLRITHGLTDTKIETDSYIAVQLIEHYNTLSVDSVRKMAEAVSGSYVFTMLDTRNTLWLVKGDNPLTVLHFPKLQMYVYASTSSILMGALVECDTLCREIVEKNFVQIPVECGDIVRVTACGEVLRDRFEYEYGYYGRYDWRAYSTHGSTGSVGGWTDYKAPKTPILGMEERIYLAQIKQLARSIGYDDSDIDEWLEAGFSLDEIADWLYEDEEASRMVEPIAN
jgi:glutamine phosphoribosylpyrophosphate amidotransferase